MNHFLTPVTNAIIARNGTIDKYMGDAVMAFWNAPLDDAAQESDACHAALDMLARVDALNQEREREASAANVPFIPILMGIGINTGRCTVATSSSRTRPSPTGTACTPRKANDSGVSRRPAAHAAPRYSRNRCIQALGLCISWRRAEPHDAPCRRSWRSCASLSSRCLRSCSSRSPTSRRK
jgi:hypothetical protein